MILYTENSKDSTNTLLETINKYSKDAGYKINVQKSTVFLYINNETAEKKKKNSFCNCNKKE